MPFLAAVKDAKFRTFVQPGQTLAIAATLAHEGSGFAVTTAEISVESKPVCSAELRFRTVSFPSPEFRASMERVAATIAFPMETPAHD
jgi:3-hydroxyacyl-[acyl-carrier-protein] dehydratase